jgi:hypothetical protein
MKLKSHLMGAWLPCFRLLGNLCEIFEILHLDSLRVSTIIEYCPHLVNLSIGDKLCYHNTPSQSVYESFLREIN